MQAADPGLLAIKQELEAGERLLHGRARELQRAISLWLGPPKRSRGRRSRLAPPAVVRVIAEQRADVLALCDRIAAVQTDAAQKGIAVEGLRVLAEGLEALRLSFSASTAKTSARWTTRAQRLLYFGGSMLRAAKKDLG